MSRVYTVQTEPGFPGAFVPVLSPRDRLAERLASSRGPIVFLLLSVGFGLFAFQHPLIATAHALGTTGIGAYWAMQGKIMRVAWTGAYIAGCEVFWRMSDAIIFWEYGKYSVILIFMMTLVRLRYVRLPMLALGYFLLLVPAIPFALGDEHGLAGARQQISFNLSGPLCLFVAAWFFHHVKFDRTQLTVLLLVLAAPIAGVGAISTFTTVTAENLVFYGQSNVATSGGFGPNQVSSTMGLGITCGLLWVLLSSGGSLKRYLMMMIVLLMVAQTGLTFSRSGLGLALLSSVAAGFYLIRNPRTRVAFLMMAVVFFAFVQFAMIPYLDSFTGGMFSTRFSDPSTTGRTELALMDLQIWQENLLVGVGPGQATPLRRELGHWGAAHTEFTRVLAEHGILGALSSLMMVGLVIVNFLRTRGAMNRGVVAAFAVYGLAFMTLNAFRIAAPAVAIGLTCAAYAIESGVARGRRAGPLEPARILVR